MLLAFFVVLLTCKSFADNEEVAEAKNEINDAAKDFGNRFSGSLYTHFFLLPLTSQIHFHVCLSL